MSLSLFVVGVANFIRSILFSFASLNISSSSSGGTSTTIRPSVPAFLANLKKLLSYSQKLIKKNTVLIFLKGKTVNEELMEARKDWSFDFEKHQSISDSRGKILIIKNLKKI